MVKPAHSNWDKEKQAEVALPQGYKKNEKLKVSKAVALKIVIHQDVTKNLFFQTRIPY